VDNWLNWKVYAKWSWTNILNQAIQEKDIKRVKYAENFLRWLKDGAKPTHLAEEVYVKEDWYG